MSTKDGNMEMEVTTPYVGEEAAEFKTIILEIVERMKASPQVEIHKHEMVGEEDVQLDSLQAVINVNLVEYKEFQVMLDDVDKMWYVDLDLNGNVEAKGIKIEGLKEVLEGLK